MYTLYWSPDTGAFVVEAVLEEIGAAYELRPVLTREGRHREPAYLEVNPLAQVPSLRLQDGTVMAESAAIVLHLADAHGTLIPEAGSSARALTLRWLLYLATNLYETDLRYVYAERYTTDPNGALGVKAAALARFDRLLGPIEAALDPGPFLLGDELTIADHYLFMLALWHPARAALFDRLPNLGRHAGLMRSRPAIERIWERNYPKGGDSAWSSWTGSNAS